MTPHASRSDQWVKGGQNRNKRSKETYTIHRDNDIVIQVKEISAIWDAIHFINFWIFLLNLSMWKQKDEQLTQGGPDLLALSFFPVCLFVCYKDKKKLALSKHFVLLCMAVFILTQVLWKVKTLNSKHSISFIVLSTTDFLSPFFLHNLSSL